MGVGERIWPSTQRRRREILQEGGRRFLNRVGG